MFLRFFGSAFLPFDVSEGHVQRFVAESDSHGFHSHIPWLNFRFGGNCRTAKSLAANSEVFSCTTVSVRANTPLTDLIRSEFAAFSTIDGMPTVPASSRIRLGAKWKNSEGASQVPLPNGMTLAGT